MRVSAEIKSIFVVDKRKVITIAVSTGSAKLDSLLSEPLHFSFPLDYSDEAILNELHQNVVSLVNDLKNNPNLLVGRKFEVDV